MSYVGFLRLTNIADWFGGASVEVYLGIVISSVVVLEVKHMKGIKLVCANLYSVVLLVMI